MADRVLVIDDAPVIREFLREVLTDFGFTVDTAEDGKQGYEMAARNDYVIILCDVHMPIMNGLITVTEIKRIKPQMPIIMTDSLPEQQAEQAVRAGAVSCLSKPFDLDELKTTINSILKNKTQLIK
jgi:DNA-binding response OmpR family regulator